MSALIAGLKMHGLEVGCRRFLVEMAGHSAIDVGLSVKVYLRAVSLPARIEKAEKLGGSLTSLELRGRDRGKTMHCNDPCNEIWVWRL